MRIIHTADLHLGQVIYQHYDRVDEHRHFFKQLSGWCKEERPDALLVSGDVFDVPQPSSSTKLLFNKFFVSLHEECPEMTIVITAGNHDSASRIKADSPVWHSLGVHLVGVPPSPDSTGDLFDRFVVRIPSGYIVALPFMSGDRRVQIQSILDRIEKENVDGLPVVMMGHQAVTGADLTGHGEVGNIRTQDVGSFGTGYDYLALGHIHKPQTLGYPEDALKTEAVTYPGGVARYCGSALHVSCDEAYPHTVSVVDIPSHGGDVTIRPLRIDELRHFYVLPEKGSFTSPDDALEAIKAFCKEKERGYFRLQVDYSVSLPSNFSQSVFNILSNFNDEVRFNPKTIWTGMPTTVQEREKPVFQIAELQQMTDPMVFIEKTADQYPDLDLEVIRAAFKEVEEELKRKEEDEN